jgi:hypothetical protein
MAKVRKPSNSECRTPPSVPFRLSFTHIHQRYGGTHWVYFHFRREDGDSSSKDWCIHPTLHTARAQSIGDIFTAVRAPCSVSHVDSLIRSNGDNCHYWHAAATSLSRTQRQQWLVLLLVSSLVADQLGAWNRRWCGSDLPRHQTRDNWPIIYRQVTVHRRLTSPLCLDAIYWLLRATVRIFIRSVSGTQVCMSCMKQLWSDIRVNIAESAVLSSAPGLCWFFFSLLFHPEDGDRTFLRNVDLVSVHYMPLYPQTTDRRHINTAVWSLFMWGSVPSGPRISENLGFRRKMWQHCIYKYRSCGTGYTAS